MRTDFRPIPGYEGHYEINSEGLVVSIKFNKRLTIKQQLNNKGYPTVILQVKDKQKRFLVHRLVWMSHKGEIPEGIMVLHGEGNDPLNCCIEYLSLGTYHDNLVRDKERDGQMPRGSKNGNSKLTETQVSYLKQRLRDGMKARTLAKLFEVTEVVISHIKNGQRWAHVS